MIKLHAYLNFDGTCEAAFQFYQAVFGGKISGFFRYDSMPPDSNMVIPDDVKNRILHTSLAINEHSVLMGSDIYQGFGQTLTHGNSTYIMLDTDTAEQAKELYEKLSVNGNIEMELAEQFFAEQYASFQDQFGIWWMIHYEGNKKMS